MTQREGNHRNHNENVLTIPVTLIPFIVTSLLTIGIIYAGIRSSYSQTDGKVLEQRVANLEEHLKRIETKLDTVLGNIPKR